MWLALKQRDPASADLINENDVKRLVRAFELLEEGTSYAQQREAFQTIPQQMPAVFLGLQVDPEILRNRIDARGPYGGSWFGR